jgi:hypothetical protein
MTVVSDVEYRKGRGHFLDDISREPIGHEEEVGIQLVSVGVQESLPGKHEGEVG